MDRIDPRDQFGWGERFGNIIIRADHQAVDLVHLLAFGGEHDNADRLVFLPHPAADLESVDARHHNIE